MDFNESEFKESKLGRIFLAIIAGLILLGGVYFFLIRPMRMKKDPVEISLSDYLIIKSTGNDGEGKIETSLNKTAFVIDYEGRIYDKNGKKPIKARNFINSLDKNITYAISKEKNLKNGDQVNIIMTYPEDIYKNFGVEIKDTTAYYEVDGLADKKESGDKKEDKSPSEKSDEKKEKEKASDEEKKAHTKEDESKVKTYKTYLEENFHDTDRVEFLSASYQGKIKASSTNYYVYKILTKEILDESSQTFTYYLAVYEKGDHKEVLGSSFTHRLKDPRDKKVYDICYEGFAFVEDLIDFLDDGNLEIEDLDYYGALEPEDELSGYYYPGAYSLFLADDQKLRLMKDDLVYTGSWQRKDGKLSLNIPDFRNGEILADLDEEGLIFDSGIFD